MLHFLSAASEATSNPDVFGIQHHFAEHLPESDANLASSRADCRAVSTQQSERPRITAYRLAEIAAGLPETVWAAAVPANYDRQICELIEDIYGDHMYLVSAAAFLVSILCFSI